MRVPAPRLAPLLRLLSVNPATAFVSRGILAAQRRRRDSFTASRIIHYSDTPEDDDDEPLDDTAMDDCTLVESSHPPTLSGGSETTSLNDAHEDKIVVLKTFVSPIIYPLPTSTDLLAHEPTLPSPTSFRALPPVLSPIPPPRSLSPPPAHFKRKRAHIISYACEAGEDLEPEPTATRLDDPDNPARFPF
ncbi:hypothetical protein BC834DRAFT_972775 [Gloeopeniophorella convolvens]|nr:hypothetical protein BC834DRAFT_972775 [Gloeopeniophorella convolvens]